MQKAALDCGEPNELERTGSGMFNNERPAIVCLLLWSEEERLAKTLQAKWFSEKSRS